jgi:hypothetical protein
MQSFGNGNPMADESPLAKAHEAIGEFACAFSEMDYEIGELIKVVYRLRKHEAADAIVAALGDFARKASLVWVAALQAKNVDESDTSPEWKSAASSTFKEAFACNDERVALSHALLQPNADGSVRLVRLRNRDGELRGQEGSVWSTEDFKGKIDKMAGVTARLRTMKNDLDTLTITIPDVAPMDWFQPFSEPIYPRKMSPALMAALSDPKKK